MAVRLRFAQVSGRWTFVVLRIGASMAIIGGAAGSDMARSDIASESSATLSGSQHTLDSGFIVGASSLRHHTLHAVDTF